MLPPDHPDPLASMHDLAVAYAGQGQHPKAAELHAEALAGRRRVLPPDHPAVLMSLWGVAHSLVPLGRGAEALPLIDECVRSDAGRNAHPTMIVSVMHLRLEHFIRSRDPAGCRATAEMWEGLGRPDALGPYKAACFRGVAAGRYAAAGVPAEAAADADRAIDWLRRAIAAGWRDRGALDADADLRYLRDRADFRELVGTVPYLAPPPRVAGR